MTQHLSQAQLAQQTNRTSDGKYANKEHSEAEVHLGFSSGFRGMERLVDGHDDAWHEGFIENDVPKLRDIAVNGLEINDPYDVENFNSQLQSIDMHLFYDERVDPYDAAHENSGYEPEIWVADKQGQTWAKLENQQLLSGGEDEEGVHETYPDPDDLFSDDDPNAPALNDYDYYDGDYDFVHVIPEDSYDDLPTIYDDPKSELNQPHPQGETMVDTVPEGHQYQHDDPERRIAEAMERYDITTGVEYGRELTPTDPDLMAISEAGDFPSNKAIVHFYRTDDQGVERHFAMPYAKGIGLSADVHGAEAMHAAFRDVGQIENSFERYDVDDWAKEIGLDYEESSTNDPDYRHAAVMHKAIDTQRTQLVTFFGDENIVDDLATYA